MYLAVDIGGTKLAAAVVDDDGRVVVRDRVATPQRDVWPALERLILRVMAAAPAPLVAVGAGCGGPHDLASSTVSPLHIPSLVDFDLRTALAEATSLPAFIDNDAKALTLGEAWCGAGRGEMNMVGVVVGTGVGGGILSNGRLLQGRLGNAGHIGHIVVEPDGRPCSCGGVGCLEAYACGPAIEAETGRPPQRAPQSIIERTGLLVGRALSSLAAVVDFKLAVVGGSVALGFGEPFFAAAQAEVALRAKLSFTEHLEIRRAGLGELAPLVGAAAVARRGLGVGSHVPTRG
ncbi:MAG: putative sugar kinase [Ilumatobacteraceae bacterium]|nr:putative sugar kinase [Ilumatobacteraceae bacterium]MCU1389444.1 putative sugar kinase [Ilumatobacteraceae bacterium]